MNRLRSTLLMIALVGAAAGASPTETERMEKLDAAAAHAAIASSEGLVFLDVYADW